MFRYALAALLFLLGAVSPQANAYEPFVPAKPWGGTYWNPAFSGAGYQIDVMPSGFIFAGVYVYDAVGNPLWFTFSGQYVPSTVEEWAQSGVIGRAQSMLYRSEDGACLGCAPRTPVSEPVPEYGQAEMVWYDTRRVELRWTGGSILLTRTAEFVPGNAVDALVKGTWRGTRITYSSACPSCEPTNFTEKFDGYYEIEDRPTAQNLKFYIATLIGNGVNVDGVPQGQEYQADPGVTLPSLQKQFDAKCLSPEPISAESCGLFNRTVATRNESNKILYHDSATGAVRALTYCGLDNASGCGRSGEVAAGSGKYEFLFVSEDKIVVRLLVGYPGVNGHKFGDTEFVLTRVNGPIADLNK